MKNINRYKEIQDKYSIYKNIAFCTDFERTNKSKSVNSNYSNESNIPI